MALPAIQSTGGTLTLTDLKKRDEAFLDGQNMLSDTMTELLKVTKEMFLVNEGLAANIAEMLAIDKKPEAKDVGSAEAGKDDLFKDMKDIGLGFGDILGAAILAYAWDLDKYIRTFVLADTMKSLIKIPEAFNTAFGKVGKYITKKFVALDKLLAPKDFKSLTGAFKYIMVPLKNITEGMTRAGQVAETAFKDLKGFTKIGRIFRPIMDIFRFIKDTFVKLVEPIVKPLMNAVKGAGKFLPLLKAVMSKILMPLFVLFDGISGFLDGFAKKEDDTRGMGERILDGALGAISKIIQGIVFVPLDLIKDFGVWIAEKLGFEVPEEFKDFSITKWFDEGFRAVTTFFKDLFKDPAGTLEGILPQWIVDTGAWIYDNFFKGYVDAFDKLMEGDIVGAAIDALIPPWMQDFAGWIKEKLFDPVTAKFSNLFGGGEDEGGGFSLDMSSFKIPSMDSIEAAIGEKINNAFQSMAQTVANLFYFPGRDAIAKMLSDGGTAIGNYLGAENLSKFNVESKKIDVAETPDIKKQTAEMETTTKEVKKKEAEKAAAPPVVVAPNNSQSSTTNISSTSVYKADVPVRSARPAIGAYAIPSLM